MIQRVTPSRLRPKGHQQITDVSSAVGLTLPAGAVGAEFAYIQAIGANVRWRDDGTDPTATVGTLLYDGQPPLAYSGDLSAIKFIDDGAITTATSLEVSYYATSGN